MEDPKFLGTPLDELHSFDDPDLRRLALTHASTGKQADNERLEFLGDAVLDLIVAEELFRAEPPQSEGEMTEHKAWIVSRDALAGAARRLELDDHAHLGHGMRDRRLPRSVMANLYEAYIGAVYLDAGLTAAASFARRTLSEALRRVKGRELGESHNPKQELQRRAQVQNGEPPEYVLLEQRGHAHARAFLMAAELAGPSGPRRFPSAWGRTRKEAERWAAYEALLILDAEDA